MRRGLLIGILASLFLLTTVPQTRAVERKAVDQAIERGVLALRSLQRFDGTWPHPKIGATSLAALTLLECGAKANDPAVQKAANAVRMTGIGLTDTYSLALSILFLDQLNDPNDVPLIESLALRLLAGQNRMGGWEYHCPSVSDAEIRRLTTQNKKRSELVGRRKPPRRPPKGRRTVDHLSPEIRKQLRDLKRITEAVQARPTFDPFAGVGDNSNTQFATLALWVSRRYGLPVDAALAQVGTRFRTTQNADGGWGYVPGRILVGRSIPTMTCAGVLGLTVAHGAARHGDPRKDKALENGLLVLGSVIGDPVGPRDQVPLIGGRAYYFLWSLERVAVALDLERIGKKDWYGWGAEVLLANQQQDGSWQGAYGDFGADTCFALLFLRRANLATDLTAKFKGHFGDPGARVLRGGGIGGKGLVGRGTKMKPALDPRGTVVKDGQYPDRKPNDPPKKPALARKPNDLPMKPEIARKPPDKPHAPPPPAPPVRPAAVEDTESARLAGSLVRASADEQGSLLNKLRDSKGVQFTEALATAIPRLKGETKDQARDALASRLARMKAKTLKGYLADEDAEIRRAAALACAMKEAKEHIPTLIRLLSDPDPVVERAAYTALKELTGQDFGPRPGASRADRARAIVSWQIWWSKQGK
jgi:hypothetical protein